MTSKPEPTPESEFEGIGFTASGTRPVMSRPPEVQATRKFIWYVRDNLDIPETTAETAADWILNLMERYGARTARGVFTIDGAGPVCSWCGAIWPLCGHHHMSEETEENTP